MTKKRKNRKIWLVSVILVVLLVLVWLLYKQLYSSQKSETAQSQLVTVTYCSDICPDNTRTFQVYKDVDSQEECEQIKGQTILDAAWGGYIGCRPRAIGEPEVVRE